MSKHRKVRAMVFGPGDQIRFQSYEALDELQVLSDSRRSSSLLNTAPPAFLEAEHKVLKVFGNNRESIVGVFAGDGEPIDFAEGPENDWRKAQWGTGNDDQMEAVAQDICDALDDRADDLALMHSNDGPRMSPVAWLQTVALSCLSIVMCLIVVTYVQENGMPLTSGDAQAAEAQATPTVTPSEVP